MSVAMRGVVGALVAGFVVLGLAGVLRATEGPGGESPSPEAAAPAPSGDSAEAIRVSLSAQALSEPSAGPATGPYVPREGHLCILQLTAQNRSARPVILTAVTIGADGYVSMDGRPDSKSFHGEFVKADEVVERSGQLQLGLRYSKRYNDDKHDAPLHQLTNGEQTLNYNWAWGSAFVLPGKSYTQRVTWLPVRTDGGLTMTTTATVWALPWSKGLSQKLWIPRPGSQFPPPPAWTKDGGDWRDRPPEAPLFWLSFVRPPENPADSSFEGALIERLTSTEVTSFTGVNRILVQPAKPALKALLPQSRMVPQKALYSPALSAWFLSDGTRTLIVTPTRRLSLNQDVGEFMLGRLYGGLDAAPWEFDLSDTEVAEHMSVRLAGLPVRYDKRHGKKYAQAPAAQLIDRLEEVDRLGLKPSGDSLYKK